MVEVSKISVLERIKNNSTLVIFIFLILCITAFIITGQVMGESKASRDIVPSGESVDFTYFIPVKVWENEVSKKYEIAGEEIGGSNVCKTYTYESISNNKKPSIRSVFQDFFTSKCRVLDDNFVSSECIDTDQVRAKYVSKKCKENDNDNLDCFSYSGEIINDGEDYNYTKECKDYKPCSGYLGSLCFNYKTTGNKLIPESKCLSIHKIFLPESKKNSNQNFYKNLNIIDHVNINTNIIENNIVVFRNEPCNPSDPKQKLKFLKYSNPTESTNSTSYNSEENIYTQIIFRGLNFYLDVKYSELSIKSFKFKIDSEPDGKINDIMYITPGDDGESAIIEVTKTNGDKASEGKVLYGGSGYTTIGDKDILEHTGKKITIIDTDIVKEQTFFVFKDLDKNLREGKKWIFMPKLDTSGIIFPESYFSISSDSVKKLEQGEHLLIFPGRSRNLLIKTNNNLVTISNSDSERLISYEKIGYLIFFEIFTTEGGELLYKINCDNFRHSDNGFEFDTNVIHEKEETAVQRDFEKGETMKSDFEENNFYTTFLKYKDPTEDNPVILNKIKFEAIVSETRLSIFEFEYEPTSPDYKSLLTFDANIEGETAPGKNDGKLINITITNAGYNRTKEKVLFTFSTPPIPDVHNGKYQIFVKDITELYEHTFRPNKQSPFPLIDTEIIKKITATDSEEDLVDKEECLQQIIYAGDFDKFWSDSVGQANWFYDELKIIKNNKKLVNDSFRDVIINFFNKDKDGDITPITKLLFLKSLQYQTRTYNYEELGDLEQDEELVLGKFIPYNKIDVKIEGNDKLLIAETDTQNLNYGVNLKNLKLSTPIY